MEHLQKIITENRKKIKEGMKDILLVLKAVTSIHYEALKYQKNKIMVILY